MSNVTMREMLEAGVHFGHQTRYWNPSMAPYLFGQRNKIHIINLEKTLPLYEEAMNFVSKMASRKGTILFVGTKRSAQSIVAEEAERCGMPYINRRWLGGLLTNFKTVKGSINRLKEIETMQTDGSFERINKKEKLMLRRELDKLKANLSGIKDMKDIPDGIFIVDVGYENIAVNEAVKLGIPVVGIVDSNNSPKGVDYVIPGNDDAIRSITLYAKGVADAILESKQSVAHLGGGEDNDDLVEIDESGAPVEAAEVVVKPKVAKKTTKKKVVKKDEVKKDEVKKNTNRKTKSKGRHNWTNPSRIDEGKRVYTKKGTGEILKVDNETGHYLILMESDDSETPVPIKSVKFKAFNDDYRDNYEVDKNVRTKSGAASISCGDTFARAMKGITIDQLPAIYKENGLQDRLDKYVKNGADNGMIRMHLGNILRPRYKRSEPVTILGQSVDDAAMESDKRDIELAAQGKMGGKEKAAKKKVAKKISKKTAAKSDDE